MGDFSGATYDADFSLSPEEAQERKHRFVARMLNIKKGTRVLHMGCGWGPLLKFLKGLGAEVKGLTLSSAQSESCRNAGFDVWLPYGSEQIERNARPYFRTVSKSSGRLDYRETIQQWGRRYRSFDLRKYAFYLSLVPRYLSDHELRQRLSRDQLRRIVFEKV